MKSNDLSQIAAIGLGLWFLMCTPASAENFARGQELYGHHCGGGCHDISTAPFKDRKVKTLAELSSRIANWAAHTGMEWGKDEIDDVSYYLNTSFYHFGDRKR